MRAARFFATLSAPRTAVTETVLINATGTVNASPSAGTAVACLSDHSDATYCGPGTPTYYGGKPLIISGVGFADLVGTGVIAAFTVLSRGQHAAAVGPSVFVDTLSGVTTSPSSKSGSASGTGILNVRTGPFTKSGGGTWTAAEINAVTLRVYIYSATSPDANDKRLHELSLEVTFA